MPWNTRSRALKSRPCLVGTFSSREQSIGVSVSAMNVENTTAKATVTPN